MCSCGQLHHLIGIYLSHLLGSCVKCVPVRVYVCWFLFSGKLVYGTQADKLNTDQSTRCGRSFLQHQASRNHKTIRCTFHTIRTSKLIPFNLQSMLLFFSNSRSIAGTWHVTVALVHRAVVLRHLGSTQNTCAFIMCTYSLCACVCKIDEYIIINFTVVSIWCYIWRIWIVCARARRSVCYIAIIAMCRFHNRDK